jgi:5,6,7,8-tetrahydromethanopterin hydro-lyase
MSSGIEVGESFVGSGGEAAHVNTVLGPRDGPVGVAWATALATPTSGFARFVVVARPGIAVRPMTLFVNKSEISPERPEHARMTWGPAQAGVAGGVADALRGGLDPELLLIAAVWVDPDAADAELVYRNNREATRLALEAGAAGGPAIEAILEVADTPSNPFYP